MSEFGDKKFDTILEALADEMLSKEIDKIEDDSSIGDIESDSFEENEADHNQIKEQLDQVERRQSELILICSSLVVLLYDKNIVDRNAMRQLLLDTDRIQSDGMDGSGSMEYLRNLLSGKTVPSTHDVSPDGPLDKDK